MRAILAIGASTIVELRRQRLLIVPIIALVLSLLVLSAALIVDSTNSEIDVREASLAAYTVGLGAGVGAALYALIVGSSLIARELSAGTMLMLAARPVGRWQILLGRLLASALFLLVALIGVDVIYGIVASVLSGDIGPIDDALSTLKVTAPALLLALCVGTAFSVQNRATAATGAAMAIAVFALVVSAFASGWQQEQHMRSYLVDDVEERLESNQPFIGGAAVLVTRVLPLGVFAAQASRGYEEIDANAYDFREDRDKPINVTRGDGFSLAGPVGEEIDDVDDLEDPVFECGRAECFRGIDVAWKQDTIPPRPQLDDGSSILLAWLAIPLWAGLAMFLLARRRDLA